jgi:endonuclease VIII
VRETRPRMRASATDGIQDRFRTIYGRAGLPCPRCGGDALIQSRPQGDGNRLTYWCPACQR